MNCKTSDFKKKDPTRAEYEYLGKALELNLLELNGDAFVRASRGELVNAEAVERIVRNGDGSATLGLRGGATVHVSRRRAAEVWERLAE